MAGAAQTIMARTGAAVANTARDEIVLEHLSLVKAIAIRYDSIGSAPAREPGVRMRFGRGTFDWAV